MADNKEALPVVAWRMNMMEFNDEARPMFHYAETPPEGDDNHFTWQALVKHATATAAIAELLAEVERLRTVVDQAGITITVSPEGVLWEFRGAARAGASGSSTENKPSQPHESNPAQP